MTHRNRQPAGRPTGGQFAPDSRADAQVSLSQDAVQALTHCDHEFGEYVIRGELDIDLETPDEGQFLGRHIDILQSLHEAGIKGSLVVRYGPHDKPILSGEDEMGRTITIEVDHCDPGKIKIGAGPGVGWSATVPRDDIECIREASTDLMRSATTSALIQDHLDTLTDSESPTSNLVAWQSHRGSVEISPRFTGSGEPVTARLDEDTGAATFTGNSGEEISPDEVTSKLALPAGSGAALGEAVADAGVQGRMTPVPLRYF